ncbi:MAG TPA: serine/threonine-protein kinase, partial [Polyangiales bacterium]
MAEALHLQSLGKYDLIVSLGRGGMANVYLALVAGPGRFNKLLVLKILRDDVMASAEEGVNMFLDEARLSARLEHPNIVHTYEVGECEGRYFLAMEYLDGQSYRIVQQRARASGTAVPIDEELRIIAETARGLHYAHQLKGYNGEPLNVVHRDVSPQNVFITYDGQIKLLDFGIAKTSDSEHLTQVGVIKGKLEYIAPEQIHGEAIDCRADVFALGAMLWEAITGRRFAGGPKVAEVAKVHTRMTGGEPNVRSVQPDVPEPLARIVDRAIALRPDQRWPDAGAFADALDAYLETTGQKPSAKSLAAFVGPLFVEQRRQTSKLIEQQIEKVKERGPFRIGENTGSLPRLKLEQDSTSGVYVGGIEAPQTLAESAPRSLAPLRHDGAVSKRGRLTLWLVAGGAGLALALGGFMLRPARTPEAVATTAPSAPVSTPVQTAPAAPAQEPSAAAAPSPPQDNEVGVATLVSLTLRVVPERAEVTLDGAPLTTPFDGKFRKDAALHHLVVSADGHRSEKRLIAFDQDHAIEV